MTKLNRRGLFGLFAGALAAPSLGSPKPAVPKRTFTDVGRPGGDHTATVTVSGGRVTSVTIVASGSGYSTAPVVTFGDRHG